MKQTTPTETTPQERCDEPGCDELAAWCVDFTEHVLSRNPPFAFFDRYFCDAHLTDEARAVIVEWALPDKEKGVG